MQEQQRSLGFGLKLSGFCFCVVLLCSMLLNVHFLLRELHKARHPDVGVTRLRLDDTLKDAVCGGRQCDEGCCPYSGWVCCEDGLHCADTEAECMPDNLRMEVAGMAAVKGGGPPPPPPPPPPTPPPAEDEDIKEAVNSKDAVKEPVTTNNKKTANVAWHPTKRTTTASGPLGGGTTKKTTTTRKTTTTKKTTPKPTTTTTAAPSSAANLGASLVL